MQVELDPQPRERVARVPALHPQAECPVDLGHADGHVDAVVAMEVTLVRARLDGGQQRVLHVHGHLGEAGTALADVDLAGELRRVS